MQHQRLNATGAAQNAAGHREEVEPVSSTALIRQFRNLRVLVIGDAMLDTYLEGTATRLCSEGPVPVVSRTATYRVPGGAANTAANLCALDAKVIFLSIVGRDLAGSLLRSTLQEHGVSDQWLVEDELASTLHKLRIVADGQYIVRFDEGGMSGDDSAACYSMACQQQLLRKLDEAYALCDVVVVSDYCYGVCSEQLIARLQELLSAERKVVLVDSKSLEHFRTLPATVVTPNYREACLLVERMGGEPFNKRALNQLTAAAIEHTARQLCTLLAAQQVAITMGEHGVCLCDQQGLLTHLPAHRVTHAHDVGAGDSFASAMALALAAGGDMLEAARIAIDAASIAVTRQRTAVVHYQELLQRVSLRAYAAYAQTASHETATELAALAAHLSDERMAGRTVVFTNGVFDMLHAGHMQFLRQAKSLGDVLVVGLNSDRSVQRLQGRGWPINSERDRMALVSALDIVDYVVLFDEDTPTALIRALRPQIHVKGGDYADEELPEAEAVREVGGQVVILPLAGSMSTSSMIHRIVALATNEHMQQSEPDAYEQRDRACRSEGQRLGGEL